MSILFNTIDPEGENIALPAGLLAYERYSRTTIYRTALVAYVTTRQRTSIVAKMADTSISTAR